MKRVALPDPDYTVKDQQRMEAATNYFQWQYELIKDQIGNRVLEIGCGLGNVTALLQEAELVVGIDVEPECLRQRDRRFAGRTNIVSQCLDVLDEAFLNLKKFEFDSVLCLNVLEHISDDQKALHHIAAILKPAGKVILIVPAFKSLYGPIDSNLGHFRRYSKKQLFSLATSSGFDISVAHYMNFVGSLGWWFNARILRKTAQSEHQIRFFDSVIVPIMSRTEKLVHPPIGQNIFAVLCKK